MKGNISTFMEETIRIARMIKARRVRVEEACEFQRQNDDEPWEFDTKEEAEQEALKDVEIFKK